MRLRWLVTVLLVGACQGPAATAAPAGPSATPAAGATADQSVTPAGPVTGGGWVDAGELGVARMGVHLVALPDGRVALLGDDHDDTVTADSALVDVGDPLTRQWTPVASLPKARGAFGAGLVAGRGPMVVGGINDDGTSFSSSYLLGVDTGTWTKGPLLDQARTSPAAIVLADGRMLVAGGFYGEALASPICDPSGQGTCAIPEGRPLGSAEILDPAGDSWTRTGNLVTPRADPAATLLADGRVLLAGSGPWARWGAFVGDDGAGSAELFDPERGRFQATGPIPAVDLAPLGLRVDADADPGRVVDPGTLVPLPGGGALLVGESTVLTTPTWEAEVARVLEFRGDGSWAVLDVAVAACGEGAGRPDCESGINAAVEAGHARPGALAAPLADGSVLVAGGEDLVTGEGLALAWRYDPATNTWTPLPPLPEPRIGATALLLQDGSVLVAGGAPRTAVCDDGVCERVEEPGSAAVVRFVPDR